MRRTLNVIRLQMINRQTFVWTPLIILAGATLISVIIYAMIPIDGPKYGGGGSKRQEVKILLRRLKRDNPNIENSIFRSIHAVALDTMPGYKSEGVEHSFLERFHAMEK